MKYTEKNGEIICLYQVYAEWNSARLSMYEYTESEALLFGVQGEWNTADVHG